MSQQRDFLKRVSELSFSKSKDASSAGNAAQGSGSKKRTKSHESIQAAQLAASVDGMFINVQPAFVPALTLTNNSESKTEPESDKTDASPFYFKGRMVASSPSMINKDVFLKVWNAADVPMQLVESEWMHHKLAFEAGVPVAAPALPQVVRSKSRSGEEHLVFAVEYSHQDSIECLESLVEFSESLIKGVIKLHDDARLLHCDIKPDNVRWSNGIVRLIDFGRAQQINSATWVPGTEGYEAPEILDRMPCSLKSDAFAVGCTIMKHMDALVKNKVQQSWNYLILHEIVKGLTDPSVVSRWSLKQALGVLQNKTLVDSGESKAASSPISIRKRAVHLSLPEARHADGWDTSKLSRVTLQHLDKSEMSGIYG